MLKERSYLKLHAGLITESADKVIEETPLSIYINGRHFVTAMILPDKKREFVVGHLFSEGIIKKLEEMESIQIQEDIARVMTTNPVNVLTAKKLIVSGCGSSSSFLDESKIPKVSSGLKVGEKNVFEGVEAILGSDLHKITGGVHVVGLFDENGGICTLEDIGRHNALDKVIGYGLTKNIDFKDTFVTCTGRISSDMVLKCSVANIPIIASRGATTSLAIEIAEKIGLTIIGFVRGESMSIYTNRERIVKS